MRFLYRCHRPHLENLCARWHVSAVKFRSGDARTQSHAATAGRDPETGYAGYRLVPRNIVMMDILMLALGFAFFALAIGYTYACERL